MDDPAERMDKMMDEMWKTSLFTRLSPTILPTLRPQIDGINNNNNCFLG